MSNNKKSRFHCSSEQQKYAIRRSYAERAQKVVEDQAKKEMPKVELPTEEPSIEESPKKQFPEKFPFWARLKISKRRTTLVIDEDKAYDKQKQELVDGYVHREATHTEKSEFEKIDPNPDKSDLLPMYLKRPRKLPKRLFEPHNKNLDMPEYLRERYDKNNEKDK